VSAITKISLHSADVKQKLALQGAEPFVSDPEQFAAMLKSEMAKWAKIVKDSGATID
jgi:tripartite-type tricarboxylate transporter receptor subunit TctC